MAMTNLVILAQFAGNPDIYREGLLSEPEDPLPWGFFLLISLPALVVLCPVLLAYIRRWSRNIRR